jgi:hypothetical protein
MFSNLPCVASMSQQFPISTTRAQCFSVVSLVQILPYSFEDYSFNLHIRGLMHI